MDFWEINNFSFFISRRCICWWIFSSIGIGKIYQRLCQSWHLGCYWNHSTIWMYLSHWQKIHSEWNYEHFQLKKTDENWWKRTGFNANWIDLKIHTYLLNLTDETINEKMYNRSRDLIWNFFLQITTFFSPLFRDTNNVYELGCELYWKTIPWSSSHWYW